MKKKTINIGFPMEYEDDDHVCHYGLFLRENEVKAVEEKLQELQRKDNIINELKKYLEYEIKEWQDVDNIPTRARVEEDKDILDKIKDIESGE